MVDSHTNGVAKPADAPRPLPEICYKLRQQVLDFLAEDVQDELLCKVQSQVRVALGVIDEALQRYG